MEYKDLAKVNSEIKMTDIGRGKEYAEVPQRVQAFRKLYPEGTIETEIVACNDGVCVFKAIVKNEDKVLGTGHAYEKENSTFINKTSYIENCETSAIGRALGFLGIGSETSIASYEEVQNAKANQNNTDDSAERNKLIKEITKLCKFKEKPMESVLARGKVSSLDELETQRLKNLVKWLAGE